MREATLVTAQAQLDTAVFRLQSATRLAIDTEFMRERTYYPQLCLVQVATDSDCFLVDPLAGLDLAPLYAVLSDRSRVKILHAARQDLEVLQLAARAVPAPVFDTQVAAGLLGMPPQIGYAELVARQLGHSIDKAQTRTDWSRRPLTPEQLAYAADDVHHLLQLHAELAAGLSARGRASWLAEDAVGLEDVALYQTKPGEAWRRLKGIGRLRPREQAVAMALAEWREHRAVASDKPRGWILSDEALLAIASLAPRSVADLEGIRAVPPAVARKRGEELLELVARAQAADDGQREAVPTTRRPTPQDNALVAKLQQVVRDAAADLGISPEVLTTRRDVEALVFKDRGGSAVLRGWRREVIGEKLLAALG